MIRYSIVLVAGLAVACQGGDEENETFDFNPATGSGTAGSGDGGSGDGDGSGDADGTAEDGSGSGTMDDTGGPMGDGLAGGTIVLGESHPAGAPDPMTASPYVSASFVPDTMAPVTTCNQVIGGCEVFRTPICEEPCEVGFACVFDENCDGVCGLPCDLPCAADEECYYPIPGAPACKKVDVFDAGVLTFEGTTVPITVYPPYNASGGPTGAPYLPGAELSVSASGATGAGFDAFDADFTAGSTLTTMLDQVDTTAAYGVGHLPIAWEAGEDEIRVSVVVTTSLGTVGSFVCPGIDSTGEYDIPRPALSEAAHDEPLSTVAINVERRRAVLVDGLGTHGTVLEGVVQPVGQVELITASSESVTILQCGGLTTWCAPGVCADFQTDPMNCGECGTVCDKLQICSAGVCT